MTSASTKEVDFTSEHDTDFAELSKVNLLTKLTGFTKNEAGQKIAAITIFFIIFRSLKTFFLYLEKFYLIAKDLKRYGF